MDLSFTREHIAFRDEVRAWIQQAMPPAIRAKAAVGASFDMDEVMQWHRILYEKGWVAPHWPKEYGGTGWDATRRFLFREELEMSGAPNLSPFGLSMVGPLLIQFGSDAQKARFLPKILSGEEVWCQGYSEPNAGSDLASLQCRADDDGAGHFVVNGQKTWTTYAQYADWIFCLVRTDSSGKKQEGISFLLIDMKSPGVEVRPMLTIAGTPAFCETFFDNVVVPKENLVGPLHGGWTLAKALLGHERTLIAAVGDSRRMIRKVKRIAARTMAGGRRLLDDPGYRARIARLEVKLRGLQMANYRALAGAQLGRAPGPESSILKIRGSEILQEAYVLAMEVMGHNSLSWFNEPGVVSDEEQPVAPGFNYARATTIYGGTNEIQRNVIAKLILGLPTR
ncbi:MAG: pimeloyl-CoA dehydrogenase large subunit [Deltaproteobacteria bacterium]|nr:MAG: pimeloyl-CoA dehydrogenase large subunit [Deltaproteobacteria bacterium]